VARIPIAAEVALGLLVGAASFTLVAVALGAIDSGLLVAVVGGLCIPAVIAIARYLGAASAVPAAVVGLVAFDWYQFPPTHSPGFPSSGDLLTLLAYLMVSVLVGELAAYATRRAEISDAARRQIADEQAGLRRVATLVARGVPATELFSAVALEILELLDTDFVGTWRYEGDGTATVVAAEPEPLIPVGSRMKLDGITTAGRVLDTGRPARLDHYLETTTGSVAEFARRWGVRSAIGTPIIVEGRLWGSFVVLSRHDRPLPPDTETRLTRFTELIGTAISNTQARAELAASRTRLVAAADKERRRVVRDLHDGAQQRLVHTVVTLKMAGEALAGEGDDARSLVSEALDQVQLATTELRALAQGILPAALTRGGLRSGVEALAARMPVPVEIDIGIERLPAEIEATAYFVVAEALTNVVKHAHASHATVSAHRENGALVVEVGDDGVGGAQRDGGGLTGLADRVAALEGRLDVSSSPGGGTLIAASVPLPREPSRGLVNSA
jgi:signal transduction histidine kinase